MKQLTFALTTSLLMVSAAGLNAQRLTLEMRGAGAMPTQNFANAELNPGFGFGATVAYRLLPHTHAYGGWDWLHFRADQSFAGTDSDFEETGYTFGLRFEHPLSVASRVLYRLEGGGTYRHVEIEDAGGDVIADSGHGLGFEFGAGAVVPIGQSWRLSPVVRYRSLSPEFAIGGVTTSGELRYVALELGLAYRFDGPAATRTSMSPTR